MEFPLGYETEAFIYCDSVKKTVEQHLANDDKLNKEVDRVAYDIKRNHILDDLVVEFDDIINFLIAKTVNSVKQEGWRLDDEDGIGWYLGLYIIAYLRTKPFVYKDFDMLFKNAFIKYFKSI